MLRSTFRRSSTLPCGCPLTYFLYDLNFCSLNFKGVCRIDSLGIAVQIQNIGDRFFHQPLLLWLDARAGCQINDTNRNERTWRWMKWNTAFSANWQPGVPKYNWVNWQWAGFTNHNKHLGCVRYAILTYYSYYFCSMQYVCCA